MSNCQHIRTLSITEHGLSDLRRCLDCSEALSGRQIAAAQARRRKLPPPATFLTEVDYACAEPLCEECGGLA